MDLARIKVGLTTVYRPVYVDSRYTGLTILGKAGGGKTGLLENAVQQDSLWPYSKIIIEPSGFFARNAYSIIKKKVHYCSLEHPVSINPMQLTYDPNTISDILAESLNQVIANTTRDANKDMTVKMRTIFDQAVKWCLKNNRRNLIAVRDYIANLKGEGETRDGIIQRLNFLLNDERMHPILCGNDSINWGKLIYNWESFILDAFGMSREKMIFVGNISSQGLKSYFRYERPKEYRPVAVYMDEAHLFVNFHVLDILKEGRKFKIGLTMATQDLAVIDPKLARVMCNVGNIIAFRLGAAEANIISREMAMSPEELQFMEKYHFAYLTGKETGIAKASRPPVIKQLEIVKVEPKSESKGWFNLASYQS